ncbi:MAG TPA: SAM-dependent chlorinase/fluorinase [Chthonomonadaceae bacterium]|nr:SAM-dependent chlorinase/fluorinase [Chthonomonadaceae bacterium]
MVRLDPPIVTLTTDFGHADVYVGVMKGVILAIAPRARLVDLTHEVGPQAIEEAAVKLEAAVPYFPDGTVHLVVVDPGVGGDRRALIVRTARCVFVAPDNGVLAEALRADPPLEVEAIDEAARPCLLPKMSATFHGRDLFAPVAARLALGAPPSQFGRPLAASEIVTLPGSAPALDGDALRIPVLYADHFGNLVTALRRTEWDESAWASADPATVAFEVGALRWSGIVATYAAVPVGAPLAYWGSSGRLEIAVRNGSAAAAMAHTNGEVAIDRPTDHGANKNASRLRDS